MVNQELLNYIKTTHQSGQSREAITQALLSAGWNRGDVEEGLRATLGPDYGTTVPREATQAGLTGNQGNQEPTRKQETAKVAGAQNIGTVNPRTMAPRSILPFAIIAGTAVIVVGIAVTFWILGRSTVNSIQSTAEPASPARATATENPGAKPIQTIATTSNETVTQNLGVADCAGDMTCFIQKAKKCEPATLKLESSNEFFGVKVTQREILGLAVPPSNTSGTCTFSIEQGKSDVVFPAGTSPEVIAKNTKQATQFDGMKGSCVVTTGTLVGVLNKRMSQGSFSSTLSCSLSTCKKTIQGFENAQCSGNYFQYKFNNQTGEVIKE